MTQIPCGGVSTVHAALEIIGWPEVSSQALLRKIIYHQRFWSAHRGYVTTHALVFNFILNFELLDFLIQKSGGSRTAIMRR